MTLRVSDSRRERRAKGRVVVLGALASRPFGGMTWQVLHHLEGLRRLGFDVWYVEDTDTPVLDPVALAWTPTLDANVEYLEKWIDLVGLRDQWVLRPPGASKETLGAISDIGGVAELYRNADAVFNLCGSHEMSDRLANARHLVLLETDPGESQVGLAKHDEYALRETGGHHSLFTYGTNLGQPDCRLPLTDRKWNTTLPPIVTDWWRQSNVVPEHAPFSSILRWRHRTGSIQWEGERWHWTKHKAFERFIDLPGRVDARMQLAVRRIQPKDSERMVAAGWELCDAGALDDPAAYREFIHRSKAEFSIAKDRYVIPRTGWFSDRTVCYLASGLPAIVQNTGLRGVPTGVGIVTFSDLQEAADAIDDVDGDSQRHAAAADEIAREYFEAERVLGEVCRTIGLL